ncbi:hypothetical protein CRUP_019437 [Coryphaenoides rupestris]|nr:hypothetical protein CRUP_019437 [Coryphaenoides rupestris]
MDPRVDWAQQQLVKTRVKRHARPDLNPIHFNDPEWSNMWYISCPSESTNNNKLSCRSEMNVMAAWQRGYTGKNVVVSILDDGIEPNHPDLATNYDQLASYDVNGNDHDPTPRYDNSNENIHGTRCAGEVAAVANNSYCIVGIAFNARIGGIRMLDGDVTDIVEAKSLGIRPYYIDIYSASWGPKDDGKTVDGPGPLAKQAFEQGIKKGRKGLGSIFVWASGNGGQQDHCSCDGYTNSIYTISISSTTQNGKRPWYLEVCSSILAATYSSAEFYDRKILPPVLSHLYGFGLVDAEAMVVEAQKWRSVPPQHTCSTSDRHVSPRAKRGKAAGVSELCAGNTQLSSRPWFVNRGFLRYIRAGQTLNSSITVSRCTEEGAGRGVAYLEHVVVKVLLLHPRRGDLEINLLSPAGTRSQLLAKRKNEPKPRLARHGLCKLKEWTLILHGTWENPDQSQESRSTVSSRPEVTPQDLQEDEYDGPCSDECGGQGCYGPDRDHCLNCIHFSLGRTCVSHCPAGYFEDPAARRCRRCQPNCEWCSGPAQCLTCRRGFYLSALNSTCTGACPPGYYGHDGQRRCLKCHESCTSCVADADRCTGCKKGYSLAGMACVLECGNGSFFHLEEMQCGPCHRSCATCTGPAQEECVRCAPDYLHQEWLCVQNCSAGYYYREAAGLHDKMCRKCRDGFTLIGKTCIVQLTCNNADEVFCEMVKSNRLCEKKLFRQFCCRTCLMTA